MVAKWQSSSCVVVGRSEERSDAVDHGKIRLDQLIHKSFSAMILFRILQAEKMIIGRKSDKFEDENVSGTGV